EALIGIDADFFRMIDDDQLEPVEIGDLVHRLGNIEEVLAIKRHKLFGLALDRLLRAGGAMASIRRRLADVTGTEEVVDEHEAFAIPGEEDGTGTSLPIGLLYLSDLVSGFAKLRLPAVVGPAEPHDVRRSVLSQPQDDRLMRLPQSSGQCCGFDARPV